MKMLNKLVFHALESRIKLKIWRLKLLVYLYIWLSKRLDVRRPQGYLILQWNNEKPVLYSNLVVDVGLRKFRDILAGSETTNLKITKFGAGSNGTAVAKTDTGLGTEIGKITGQLTGYPKADGDLVQNAFQIGASEIIGTWREVGLFFNDNVMLSHANVTERAKTGTDIVSVFWYLDMVN